MRVSVIIPTKNAVLEKQSCIAFVIQSLLYQKDRPEIIVVDQSDTDSTAELIRRLDAPVEIIRLSTTARNPAAARNVGAARASGELLLFLDDDTVLGTSDTLVRSVAILGSAAFACGAERYWTSVYWWRHVRLDQPFAATTLTTLDNISILPRGINPYVGFRDLNEFTFMGNYGLIRRDIFEEIGGFDKAYEGWGFEDTDLMMRLCLARKDYRLLCGLRVYHLTHPSSVRGPATNRDRFNAMERTHKKWFHVNHFFGVYEADGFALFSDV